MNLLCNMQLQDFSSLLASVCGTNQKFEKSVFMVKV